MDMDQLLAGLRRGEIGVAIGGHLAEPGAQHEQDVHLGEALAQLGRRRGAELAHIAVGQIVDGILTAERGGDRQAVRLGECQDVRGGFIGPTGAAEQQHGALGGGQHLGDLSHVGGRDLGARGCVRPGILHRHGGGQHVLGQGQHHRAGTAGGGDAEGLGHVFGHPLGGIDLRHPFGQRPKHGAIVDLLEGLAIHHVPAHLADEQDHGRAVLLGDVHADGGMAGAGPTGDHADAGLAGQLAIGLRHVGGAGLVAGIIEGQPVGNVMERVEHLEIALARHAEGRIGPVDQKLVHQNLARCAHLRRRVLQHDIPPCC